MYVNMTWVFTDEIFIIADHNKINNVLKTFYITY